jgi:prepilin-type N-terminal cleavage/methylation domain-containing protein
MRRLRRLWRRPADHGFTLVEVMVGAALMSVVMAIATSGFVEMYRTSAITDSAATAQSDLTDTFNRLDGEIRYAYRINPAYQIGTTAYGVDYVLSNGDGQTFTCVQLSLPLAGGTLIRRTWPQSTTPADAAATSTALATDLSSVDAGAGPFAVLSRGTDSNYDRLVLNVNSTVGTSAHSSVTRTFSVQFTALNTQTDDSATTTCTKS